jgi:trans-aconitate methyltransferase
VVGVDPEADMLAVARRVAGSVPNVSWVVGSDRDLPAVVGERLVGAVTVGQALHWMDHDSLFRAAVPLCRAGGGVAVVTNGTPMWLQESGWSRALFQFLAEWRGKAPSTTCGTDEASQRVYGESLAAAGFVVRSSFFEYADELDLDHVVGGVYSALPVHDWPAVDQRPGFEERIRVAVEPYAPFTEQVRVAVLTGQRLA